MAESSDSGLLSQNTEAKETDEIRTNCSQFTERESDSNRNCDVERANQDLREGSIGNHQSNSANTLSNTVADGAGSGGNVTGCAVSSGIKGIAGETEETQHFENDCKNNNAAHCDSEPINCNGADYSNVSDCNDGSLQNNGSGAENANGTENGENEDLEIAGNCSDVKDNAEDDNRPINAGIENGQHSLSGPQRTRQVMRGQHRQDPLARQQHRIALPAALIARWREIGNEWGLQDDDDIARVLVRHYEDLNAGRPPRPPPRPRCRGCGDVLVPVPCEACGPSHHANRLCHDSEHGDENSGGGKGGFCGRC